MFQTCLQRLEALAHEIVQSEILLQAVKMQGAQFVAFNGSLQTSKHLIIAIEDPNLQRGMDRLQNPWGLSLATKGNRKVFESLIGLREG